MVETIKCVPHIKNIEWEIKSIDIGSSDNPVTIINTRFNQIVDCLEMDIKLST